LGAKHMEKLKVDESGNTKCSLVHIFTHRERLTLADRRTERYKRERETEREREREMHTHTHTYPYDPLLIGLITSKSRIVTRRVALVIGVGEERTFTTNPRGETKGDTRGLAASNPIPADPSAASICGDTQKGHVREREREKNSERERETERERVCVSACFHLR